MSCKIDLNQAIMCHSFLEVKELALIFLHSTELTLLDAKSFCFFLSETLIHFIKIILFDQAVFTLFFFTSYLQKAIRVTTFMQRLKNSEALNDSSAEVPGREQVGDEAGISQATSDEGDKGTTDEGITSSSVSLEVTVENTPANMEEDEGSIKIAEKTEKVNSSRGQSVGTSPSDGQDPLGQSSSGPKLTPEELNKDGVKKVAADGSRRIAANLGQTEVVPEVKQTPAVITEPSKLSKSSPGANLGKQHTFPSPEPSGKRKIAATLHGTKAAPTTFASPEKQSATQSTQKDETDGSWCQTQVPEAVAERSVVAPVTSEMGMVSGVDVGLDVQLRGDASPVGRRDRNTRKTDRHSAEFSIAKTPAGTTQGCYVAGSSASLGRHAAPYNPEAMSIGMGMAGSFGSPYSSLYTSRGVGMYGTGLHHGGGGSTSTTDWQMDSVIEQIEKQMVAVLEKIEGDMPSLLEQISDCPSEPARARSTHASPSVSRSRPTQHSSTSTSTTPPLPTSPRPTLPTLPHLGIPPPSYPPPSPPTQTSPQAVREQEDKDGLRGTAQSSQSPRAGMGRGL